jgi:hypothetical protein
MRIARLGSLLREGSGPAQSCLHGKLNDAATQLDPLDRKLESTVRYLGIEVDDALQIAEQIELQSSNLVMPTLPYLPLGEGNVQRVEYGFEHVPNNGF